MAEETTNTETTPTVIDLTFLIKLAAGIGTRGVLWVFATISAMLGIETPSEDVAAKISLWIATAIAAIIAMGWEYIKSKKLLNTTPPAQQTANKE